MARALTIFVIVGGMHLTPPHLQPTTDSPPSVRLVADTSTAMAQPSPEGGPATERLSIASRLPAVETLSTTSYCQGGVMADGGTTHFGEVAMNTEPFGTKIEMLGGMFAGDIFTVEDRIGWGSQLDVFQSSCAAAWDYGREIVPVEVLP